MGNGLKISMVAAGMLITAIAYKDDNGKAPQGFTPANFQEISGMKPELLAVKPQHGTALQFVDSAMECLATAMRLQRLAKASTSPFVGDAAAGNVDCVTTRGDIRLAIRHGSAFINKL